MHINKLCGVHEVIFIIMKILVTGANGYIGQGVVKELLNRGQDVIAVDMSDEFIDTRAKIRKENIFDIIDPYLFFEQPDVVLHLAWRNGFKHNAETHIEDLPLHYSFLNSLCKSGISKVAVLGSMHEVGFWEGSVDENTPCNPLSLYGIAKNALRESIHLSAKANGNIFQWMRGYYIIGNSEHGNSIFSKITKAEKAGEVLFPFTTGKNKYDFIDYNIFCNQITEVVLQDSIQGIINCCTGVPVSLSDRVEQYIKDNDYKIRLDYGRFPDREYDSKEIWGNNEKINEIMRNSNHG